MAVVRDRHDRRAKSLLIRLPAAGPLRFIRGIKTALLAAPPLYAMCSSAPHSIALWQQRSDSARYGTTAGLKPRPLAGRACDDTSVLVLWYGQLGILSVLKVSSSSGG